MTTLTSSKAQCQTRLPKAKAYTRIHHSNFSRFYMNATLLPALKLNIHLGESLLQNTYI